MTKFGEFQWPKTKKRLEIGVNRRIGGKFKKWSDMTDFFYQLMKFKNLYYFFTNP